MEEEKCGGVYIGSFSSHRHYRPLLQPRGLAVETLETLIRIPYFSLPGLPKDEKNIGKIRKRKITRSYDLHKVPR